MALSKPFVASLIILSLFLHDVKADVLMADSSHNVGRTLVQNIGNCEAACDSRCAKASRPKICKRACGTCCKRCKCVPPGTYGNKDVCPCYANMTTHGGKPKCP